MRKLTLMIVSLLLVGCGLMSTPTPSPTPRPTATPTQEPRYYPTVDPQTAKAVLEQVPKPFQGYYSEVTSPIDGTVYSAFSLTVVSSGKIEVLKVGDWSLDVVWIYERNANPRPAFYPLVVGVEDKDGYTPYYTRYAGESSRDSYLKFLEERSILERGRLLFPGIESVKGGYVSLYGGIDWESCGGDTFCRLGQYMQEKFMLDEKVTHQIMGAFPIPEGWVLAWRWDAATEENTDPQFMKINLP